MAEKVPKMVSVLNSDSESGSSTHWQMFADSSDTEQEIILDPNLQIINLEAAEQPEAFDLTPDEDSDDSDADGAIVDHYLTTLAQSPVKPWNAQLNSKDSTPFFSQIQLRDNITLA